MKIDVPRIPPEGQTVEFNQGETWVAHMLNSEFREIYPKGAPASGRINLVKTNQNVSCNGTVQVSFSAECSRCAQNFKMDLEVPVTRHLIPEFSLADTRSDEDGVELNAEDLEFSTYRNEEIDLGEMLAEEIRLALPIRFLCRAKCKGLCLKCGANLNEGACDCPPGKEGSAFASLKDFKVKS